MQLLISIFTNSIPFFPFAFAVVISFSILRATDMTLDGSFVLGAGVFARLISLGLSPYLALSLALFAGFLAGVLVSTIQRGGRVDPLLAGVLATFILASLSLFLMGKPNISLLSSTTLMSNAFALGSLHGWILVSLYCFIFMALIILILRSRIGLRLRGLGDNPQLLVRSGYSLETYRIIGFAMTNTLAAFAGVMMAETSGFADVGMGYGMTLTGIGTIILGRQLFLFFFKKQHFRIMMEFFSALLGVLFYFAIMTILLQFDIDPIFLKMCVGIMLIFFLRTAFLLEARRVR